MLCFFSKAKALSQDYLDSNGPLSSGDYGSADGPAAASGFAGGQLNNFGGSGNFVGGRAGESNNLNSNNQILVGNRRRLYSSNRRLALGLTGGGGQMNGNGVGLTGYGGGSGYGAGIGSTGLNQQAYAGVRSSGYGGGGSGYGGRVI